MASKMIACSVCSVLVRVDDGECPHCGARRRSVSAPIASGVILLGLALAGCPSDDGTETMGGSNSASSANTESATGNTTMSGGLSQSSTTAGMTDSATTTDDTLNTSAQPPYGVPDTSSSTGSDDTDSDTDTGESSSSTGGVKLDLPPGGG